MENKLNEIVLEEIVLEEGVQDESKFREHVKELTEGLYECTAKIAYKRVKDIIKRKRAEKQLSESN